MNSTATTDTVRCQPSHVSIPKRDYSEGGGLGGAWYHIKAGGPAPLPPQRKSGILGQYISHKYAEENIVPHRYGNKLT